jgi:hypothetical protein
LTACVTGVPVTASIWADVSSAQAFTAPVSVRWRPGPAAAVAFDAADGAPAAADGAPAAEEAAEAAGGWGGCPLGAAPAEQPAITAASASIAAGTAGREIS